MKVGKMTNSIEILTLSSAAALILGVTVGLWTDDPDPYSVVHRAAAVTPVHAIHRASTVDRCPGAADEARYQRPLRPRV